MENELDLTLRLGLPEMENELDLTLRLGLPNPTVETHLSLNTLTSDQGANVVDGGRRDNNDEAVRNNIRRAIWGDGEDEGARNNIRRAIWGDGARNNMDVNMRISNYVFQLFAGAPREINFAPYPMPPAPVTPDYVLLDVPANRAHRNNSLAMMTNASGRNEGTRKCTNRNCNAITTPRWRRGPLGPKTLCNACGIKFWKEERKRSRRN